MIHPATFLLIFGALPFSDVLRGSVGFRRALTRTNAAVVGILLAALYTPIWTSAVGAPIESSSRWARLGFSSPGVCRRSSSSR
jgi:chromate transporter